MWVPLSLSSWPAACAEDGSRSTSWERSIELASPKDPVYSRRVRVRQTAGTPEAEEEEGEAADGKEPSTPFDSFVELLARPVDKDATMPGGTEEFLYCQRLPGGGPYDLQLAAFIGCVR